MPALTLRTARCRFTEALAALITFATARGYALALAEGVESGSNSIRRQNGGGCN
jgi:hypothetical protein